MLSYTLIPEGFFSESHARQMLSAVADVREGQTVKSLELPCYKAVLLYAGEDSCAIALSSLLNRVSKIDRYEKVAGVWSDGVIDIAVAKGTKLLLCNSFVASDETTAQYYLFAALSGLGIDTADVVLHLGGKVSKDMKKSLDKYFRSVVLL